jgi:hypothetical protein
MADGSTKPIEDVRVGEQVVATDPQTGRTEAKPVITLIAGHGVRSLVEITIDIDGARGSATDVITATANHPFWIPQMREWLDAGQLQPGMWLRTSAGTHVQVSAVKRWTATTRVHNLTVDELHTYYVLAGGQAVLVHNDNIKKDLMDLGAAEMNRIRCDFDAGNRTHIPGAVSVGRTPDGKIYYGESGSDESVRPEIRDRLPNPSRHSQGRPADVCAEVNLCSRALDDGLTMDDLGEMDAVTVNQKGKKFKMCPNCNTWFGDVVGRVHTG